MPKQELGQQLEAAAQAARAAMDAADAGGASSGVEAASAEASQKSGERPGGKQQQRAQSGARGAVLPGLQDLRGQWSGNLQVRLSQGFYRCSDWHMFPGLVDHKDMPDSAGNLSFVGGHFQA